MRLTACRAGDTVAVSEMGGLNFLYAAKLTLGVIAKSFVKVTLILEGLHYPAGAAAALKAKRKAVELDQALREEGVAIDVVELQELIEEGARNGDTQKSLNKIADDVDELLPLLGELSQVLSGPVPIDDTGL